VKWIFTTLLLVAAAGSCEPLQAKPSEWTEKERKLWHSYLTMSAIDTFQTFDLIECQSARTCNARELNPIIGPKPSKGEVVALKLVGNAIIYKMLDNAPADREFALKLMNGLQAVVITNNGLYIYKRF
tara:strand:- start:760 stop:1143 length:384 start_codon:yes stop_codon:yes gene_type:complete